MNKKIKIEIILIVFTFVIMVLSNLSYASGEIIKLNNEKVSELNVLDKMLTQKVYIDDYFNKEIKDLKNNYVGCTNNGAISITSRSLCWHTGNWNQVYGGNYKIQHVIDVNPNKGISVDGGNWKGTIQNAKSILNYYKSLCDLWYKKDNSVLRADFIYRVTGIMSKTKYPELENSIFFSKGIYQNIINNKSSFSPQREMRMLVISNNIYQPYIMVGTREIKNETGNLKITKVDSSNKEIKLKNAAFKITKSGENKSIGVSLSNGVYTYKNINGDTTVKSDNSGQIYVKNLPIGTYTIKEITPPQGYNIANSVNITIKAGENGKEIADTHKKGMLRIIKTDINYPDLRLNDVEYKIKNNDTGNYISLDGNDSYIFKTGYKYDFENGTVDKSTDGYLTISNLPTGEYYVKESKQPDGYVSYNNVGNSCTITVTEYNYENKKLYIDNKYNENNYFANKALLTIFTNSSKFKNNKLTENDVNYALTGKAGKSTIIKSTESKKLKDLINNIVKNCSEQNSNEYVTTDSLTKDFNVLDDDAYFKIQKYINRVWGRFYHKDPNFYSLSKDYYKNTAVLSQFSRAVGYNTILFRNTNEGILRITKTNSANPNLSIKSEEYALKFGNKESTKYVKLSKLENRNL